ncbi:hypothetical protein PILCRDRAFT_99326 [Piloderma croceum F 1598]|uniref:Amino acid transporter transmembrane domain-containing protein n=1 Tax=Piloderma croceum (strain F 1598) TaxID=765440 RepID=A0A0C3B7W2_PILCF|nr:hypothetical protein PILCRDRAFT_99326 [Piloderma croceum F 1598]
MCCHVAILVVITCGLIAPALAVNFTKFSNILNAVGIIYALCKSACETGPEPTEWSSFSPQFSTWLLPWVALVSQLSSGAGGRFENLTSFFLAVGSPTTAAYSLVLTCLSDISYLNVNHIFNILNSLQQALLKIIPEEGLLQSLVVLPENDAYWGELALWLDYTNTWSITAVTLILLVLLAYLFTVIDTFPPKTTGPFGSSDGQAVGTVWFWLLPVVVGWLQMSPKCECQQLNNALMCTSTIACVTTDSGLKLVNSDKWAFTMHEFSEDTSYINEKFTAPIFNYACFLPWTQNMEVVVATFCNAAHQAQAHHHVDECSHFGPDIWSRLFLASFFATLLQWGTAGAAIIIVFYTPPVGLGCCSGAYLVYAAMSTLIWVLLTTSSILTHFLATSRTCARSTSEHLSSDHDKVLRFVQTLEIFLCRLGKSPAACNTIWIVLVCMLQFGSIFGQCYCFGSVLGLRSRACDILIIDANEVTRPWLGGVGFACGSAVLFVGFINLFINAKPTIFP